VLHYELGTFIGKEVSSGAVFVESLCVVYQEDLIPSKDDVKPLGIIASVIGVEGKRKQAILALKESERRRERLVELSTDYTPGRV
jgi:hypothetical protein